MRWLLLTLLMCNGVMAYWLSGQQEQRQERFKAAPVSSEKQLMLVSERPAHPEPLDDMVRHRADVVAQKCLLIGPILSQDSANDLYVGMRAAGLAVEFWQKEREMEAGYWVYLPPYESRELAQRRLNRLLSDGIDSFIFGEGELVNGISLGIYSSSDNASSRKQALERRGIRPQVRLATKTVVEYWLQFPAIDRALLASKFWSDLAEVAPNAEISEKSCEPVASGPDFP
ncbi:SPOR domain-containing protein [Porticoccaceae bacterium LTM1]|nr:SPOR domain-containing protein [Porticoccaceae bacterium LTM1]